MSKTDFIIQNPAQLQVFTTLFSASLIGVVSSTDKKEWTVDDMTRRADMIACSAMNRFETHFPPVIDEGVRLSAVTAPDKQPKGEDHE